MINLFFKQIKSTTKRPNGYWRRNLKPFICLSRNRVQSNFSASVVFFRNWREMKVRDFIRPPTQTLPRKWGGGFGRPPQQLLLSLVAGPSVQGRPPHIGAGGRLSSGDRIGPMVPPFGGRGVFWESQHPLSDEKAGYRAVSSSHHRKLS